MKNTIILGGGCFWCTEAAFLNVLGVLEVTSGYAGGVGGQPTYDQVCTGRTGFAECISITFESEVVSLENILKIFFTIHDPTTLNRQGADTGTQYRSVIFYANEEQLRVSQNVIAELTHKDLWDGQSIVTSLEQLTQFYPAESYHQRYFEQHQSQGYCQIVIAPKLAKLRHELSSLLKD